VEHITSFRNKTVQSSLA